MVLNFKSSLLLKGDTEIWLSGTVANLDDDDDNDETGQIRCGRRRLVVNSRAAIK